MKYFEALLSEHLQINNVNNLFLECIVLSRRDHLESITYIITYLTKVVSNQILNLFGTSKYESMSLYFFTLEENAL
jgi:hypothetical protein